MTDIERKLRATLIEAGQQAAVVDDLGTRAVRPVRRHRTWLAAGVAAVTMATVGVAITITDPDGTETGPAASTQSLSDALIGTWRPIEIAGFDQLQVSRPRPPVVTFNTNGKWVGTDGCNGIGGTYTAGDDGTIAADARGAQTMMACANVPNREVLGQAVRFTIDGRSLIVHAADDRRLGTYERA